MADDLADILYTSGTAGTAKPVAVSHANLTYADTIWGHMVADLGSICCTVPLGTNAGHNAIMFALTAESTIDVLSSMAPEHPASTIATRRPCS